MPLAYLSIVPVAVVCYTCTLPEFQGYGGFHPSLTCSKFRFPAGGPSEGGAQSHESEVRDSVRTQEVRHSKNVAIC